MPCLSWARARDARVSELLQQRASGRGRGAGEWRMGSATHELLHRPGQRQSVCLPLPKAQAHLEDAPTSVGVLMTSDFLFAHHFIFFTQANETPSLRSL